MIRPINVTAAANNETSCKCVFDSKTAKRCTAGIPYIKGRMAEGIYRK
jgi:hypothetical protein